MTEAGRIPSVADKVLWAGRVPGYGPAWPGDGLVVAAFAAFVS
jgi:hypothetical protein